MKDYAITYDYKLDPREVTIGVIKANGLIFDERLVIGDSWDCWVNGMRLSVTKVYGATFDTSTQSFNPSGETYHIDIWDSKTGVMHRVTESIDYHWIKKWNDAAKEQIIKLDNLELLKSKL